MLHQLEMPVGLLHLFEQEPGLTLRKGSKPFHSNRLEKLDSLGIKSRDFFQKGG